MRCVSPRVLIYGQQPEHQLSGFRLSSPPGLKREGTDCIWSSPAGCNHRLLRATALT